MTRTLFDHQAKALKEALATPSHVLIAGVGLGAKEVQAAIAEEWQAVVVAEKSLHPVWKKLCQCKLVTPQWVGKHPEFRAEAVVVDELIGTYHGLAALINGAKKASLRVAAPGAQDIKIEALP